MTENDFLEFLKKKKIDPEKFKLSDDKLYAEWLNLFLKIGKTSFDQQKKFIFNALRKKYKIS